MPTSAVRDVNLASAARLRSGSVSSLPRSPDCKKTSLTAAAAAQERSQSEHSEYTVRSTRTTLLLLALLSE